jgi:penicillin-binding protein 2
VDLPNEKTGLLVDSAVHEARNKRLGWKWARGLILNLAIGQGELVTPLQLATMAGGVANGHEVMKPHLMQAILESDNGKVVRRYEPETLSVLNWSDETIGVIHSAMDSVVNGARGTGHSARLPGIEVGGKSGSAENPHGRTHAVFVCAAPMNAPEIAIGVIVENGGHGGSTAGPIAAAIMRTYFRKTGRLPKDSLGTNPLMRRMDLTPSNDR